MNISWMDAGARALLARLSASLRRPLFAALGARLEYSLRRHFLSRNAQGNAKGWPTKNFWTREGANKTALTEITDNSATVSVASPAIAHKITGGTITPKRGRALAIPATARAYAAGSPREGRWAHGELFLVKPKGGHAFLATRNGDAIEAQYWLVGSVTQAPDPQALPDSAVTAAELRAEAIAHIDRTLERSA
jgi:hypothetical protein